MDEGQNTVMLRCNETGVAVTFSDASWPFEDDLAFVDFRVRIQGDGIDATAFVRTLEGGTGPYAFTEFLASVADDWRGEEPKESFSTLDDDLELHAQRDELGHIVLHVVLRPWRNKSWQAEACLIIEAGEQMAAFARDLCALLQRQG